MDIPAGIIEGCKNGDRKAQEWLYRISYDHLMSISCRYMRNRDDAQAMVNLGYYKILVKLEQFDTNRSFASWTSRIMTNVLIDDYRKKKRKEKIESEWSEIQEHETPSEINSFEKNIEAEELNQMLLALPEIRNRVFNLYAIDGYSHEEISKLLKIPKGTSKWHLSKAREQLKEMISKKQKQHKKQSIG